MLKAKGKECEVIEDNESEVTIYKNAVDKKRESSSSEDDLGDTSDELNEIDMQAISNISFVERELGKERVAQPGPDKPVGDQDKMPQARKVGKQGCRYK